MASPISPVRNMPESGFDIIDEKYLVDEENLEWYKPDDFYPVRIGEVFESKYQVIGKLGYGSVSTVWLCRDLINHRYVTVKVYTAHERQSALEKQTLEHIAKFREADVNEVFVRSMLDSFKISWKGATHQCLVQEPMAMTLRVFIKLCPADIGVAREISLDIIRGLYFLHSVANVVHTDIQSDNIMMAIANDDPALKKFEEEQMTEPSPRKTEGDRIIYATKSLRKPDKAGQFVICDLGEARFSSITNTGFWSGEVMPDLYRAPEICLGIKWDCKIDIWALGLMLWSMVQGKQLFFDRQPNREGSTKSHLARMVALLGQPPKELLEQGSKSREFFDENGNFKDQDLIPDVTFESELTTIEGKEKQDFLRFIRMMLQWQPKDRATAEELFDDHWLDGDDGNEDKQEVIENQASLP